MLAAYVARAGLKRSRARDAILDVLLETPGHVSVEQLTARVRERYPTVGQTTVYRTMKVLVDAGLAAPRHFQQGRAVFELVPKGKHHDHLVCTGCGAIEEFESPDIESLQVAVARRHGFEIERHTMELYGRCRACTRRDRA